MIKVFISQPMKDKTEEEIKSERERAIDICKKMTKEGNVEIVDSYFEDDPDSEILHKAVFYLGKSIQKISEADVAYFVKGWNKYRGCQIEHLICKQYNIPTLEE